MPVQNFLEDEDYDAIEEAGVSSSSSTSNSAGIAKGYYGEIGSEGARASGGSFVPNFLQDEDYDDFEADAVELVTDVDVDEEYYGGGYSDGATLGDGSANIASSRGGSFGGSFPSTISSYAEEDISAGSAEFDDFDLESDTEEDELFDGSGLFGDGSDEEFDGEFGSPASSTVSTPVGSSFDRTVNNVSKSVSSDGRDTKRDVEGAKVTPRAESSTVVSEVSSTASRVGNANSSIATTDFGGGATSSSGSSSSTVPNFLEDEDEFEASVATVEAPTVTANSAAISSNVSSVSAVSSPTNGVRARRDLSKRTKVELPEELSATVGKKTAPVLESPHSESSEAAKATSSPFSSAANEQVIDDGSNAGNVSTVSGSDANGAGRLTAAVGKAVDSGGGAAVSVPLKFDERAGAEELTEKEVDSLRSPSSYASTRELKFTALNQSDATVRKVGSDGLTPAERVRKARSSSSTVTVSSHGSELLGAAGAIYGRTPSNGRLSQNELLFYANLGAQRLGDYGSASKKQLFLPPMLGESAEQKAQRTARVNRALANGSMERGKKSRLTEKDYRVLRFIALFKFVSERQIAKLLQVAEHSAYKRLNELRKNGLTKGFKTLGVKGSVWVLTETGMDLSGYELPRGSEAGLTLSMVSHQFTVNHVGAHLWSGGANVLREKNFPQKNLVNSNGDRVLGDQLISELQIQSAFGKVRGNSKADAFVPQIKSHMRNQFDSWERAGGVDFGPSPELQRGNEYMLALYPPVANRLNYHVPDLVVARQRGTDGKPQSIAVEVELKTKADDSSYERTLDAYRVDDKIFKKVVWICRLKGTAEKISRIAKRNGLADQGRISIVPIYLEDGSRFTGRDTWML